MIGKDIAATDVKRLLIHTYRRYRKGDISEAAARHETLLLNSILKAIEVSNAQAGLDGSGEPVKVIVEYVGKNRKAI